MNCFTKNWTRFEFVKMRFLAKSKIYKLLHLVSLGTVPFSYPLKSDPLKICQKSDNRARTAVYVCYCYRFNRFFTHFWTVL